MTIERLGEVVDAEIIPSKDELLASVERAIGYAEGFWAEILWQVRHRAWESLGYRDFDAMWDDKYARLGVRVSRSERPELVAELRAIGQTKVQISEKTGASRVTIDRDLNVQNVHSRDSITNSRGQSRPATYKKKEKEVPAPAVEDTRAHKSPFAEGTKLTPDTDRTVILVGADGRAYTGAPDTQKAIEYARENPRVANWEAAREIGVSTSTISRAYGALRKNGEIPATGHTERSMADMFDLIAIGARNVGTSIDMYADRISEAEPDDFDYYWEEFDQAVKKINSFRREIKRIHNI